MIINHITYSRVNFENYVTGCYHYYFVGDEGWGSDFDSEDDEYHEV